MYVTDVATKLFFTVRQKLVSQLPYWHISGNIYLISFHKSHMIGIRIFKIGTNCRAQLLGSFL